jgi:phage gp16-like protein
MQPVKAADRRALLGKVHVAKKQLAMVDDSYRALLLRVTGQDSAATCTDAQLVRVVEEFKRLGFAASRKISDKPYVRMIYGVWKELKPFLDAPSDTALAAFVQRQTGIARPEWLDGKQAGAVIEALKGWLARERAK